MDILFLTRYLSSKKINYQFKNNQNLGLKLGSSQKMQKKTDRQINFLKYYRIENKGQLFFSCRLFCSLCKFSIIQNNRRKEIILTNSKKIVKHKFNFCLYCRRLQNTKEKKSSFSFPIRLFKFLKSQQPE